MNLEFLNKIKHLFVHETNNQPRHKSESGPTPLFLWKILLTIYFVLFGLFIFLMIFSYNFLIKERQGVVGSGVITTPKINSSKIEDLNSFFNQRLVNVENVYQKTIIEPW